MNLKPYEVILQNNKKNDFYTFLDEIIKKYLKKNSYINELNEKDQYINNKFNSFFSTENNNENDQKGIQNEFFDYIQCLVMMIKFILYQITRKSIIEGIQFFEFILIC